MHLNSIYNPSTNTPEAQQLQNSRDIHPAQARGVVVKVVQEVWEVCLRRLREVVKVGCCCCASFLLSFPFLFLLSPFSHYPAFLTTYPPPRCCHRSHAHMRK